MKKTAPTTTTTSSTLADIVKASDTPTNQYVDDSTPDGHFCAAAKILGIATVYILKGELGDEGAPIVERTEYQLGRLPNRYIGDRLKGGTWTYCP
ncbi:hypothetical protein ACFVAJ_18535 [Agromyces sp. NPDC057679]|uniref:hypothetical protein n=1 Tax=Agromyces sp. NPDC057679 TaxID=3346207 RepID=UPI00366E0CA4